MRKVIIALVAIPAFAMATNRMAPSGDPEIVVPDSTGFTFTDVKVIPTTPVKDQNRSGTCWSFAATSLMEEDVMRRGGKELDLSEMFAVRNCYIDKAKKYIDRIEELTNTPIKFIGVGPGREDTIIR